MKDALIICTRNRQFDLKRCLESVANLNEKPTKTVIVDSSTNKESFEVFEELKKKNSIPGLSYVRSDERGLTIARNVGLKAIEAEIEIVHFIDDDVELGQHYVRNIRGAFSKDANLVGAGGKVLGSGYSGSNKLKTLLWLDSSKLGSVTGSGINIGSYDSDEELDMDWLPGCSMSFRVVKISGLEFDARRNILPLGEDVDFGLRASARGKLVHVPTAELFHHLSPQNRDDENSMIFQDILHRFTLAEDRLGKVTKTGVVVSTINLGILYLAGGVLGRNKLNFFRSRLVFSSLLKVCLRGGLARSGQSYSR